MRLFALAMEPLCIGGIEKIMPTGDRVEPFRIKVGHDRVAPAFPDRLHRRAFQRGAKGRGFGMCVDD
jgi:hypothetical protein